MQKKLYRSRKDKMLGGVSGGIGEYFEIDPVLVRIIFIAATFISGIGLIAYILLWIIVPFEPLQTAYQQKEKVEEENAIPVSSEPVKKKNGSAIAGIILIALGGIFLADNLIPFFRFAELWPIILIATGIGLLWNASKKQTGNI